MNDSPRVWNGSNDPSVRDERTSSSPRGSKYAALRTKSKCPKTCGLIADRPPQAAGGQPDRARELRVGDFRVFYDINHEVQVVVVVAVGQKVHNQLRIGGIEIDL